MSFFYLKKIKSNLSSFDGSWFLACRRYQLLEAPDLGTLAAKRRDETSVLREC
jgi:hypothetical protein